MNLSEKLKTFISQKQDRTKSEVVTPKENVHSVTSKILDATTVNTPYGVHLMVEKTYDRSYIHGQIKLDSIFDISPEICKLIAKNVVFEGLDFSRAVFIDTETTGLAGGTGTLAFLIGVGFFKNKDFKIIQYFINDFNEEAAALYSLSGLLKNYDSLVSFNGKSYDIPLLSARFMLNRMENPVEKTFHLDLLHSARRLYKERLESVSLSSLEENLLSIERRGDIPGYEIPSVYFRYLRDRNPYPIKPIFYHNRMDILSMVTLTASMAKTLEEPFNAKTCASQDYYCVGKIFEDMGMIDQSIYCYKKALNAPEVRERACIQLSLLLKKLGRFNEAEKLWVTMVEKNINPVYALIELAKYYEHRIKDYNMASKVTKKAIEEVYKRHCLTRFSKSDQLEKLRKRLNRIAEKQKKQTLSI
ncbi:MAG TPA: hypothetical protein GX723_09310 [Thermoanaerobacterales bacterium]|nr:hypothetical protein [Thermoanaerobacterales bacterium]